MTYTSTQSLVVTIIVLLILAGVSIMMLTGENGILTRAGEARNTTGTAQIQEELQLAISKISVDYYKDVVTSTTSTFRDYIFSQAGQVGINADLEENATFDSANKTITYKEVTFNVDSNGTVTVKQPGTTPPTTSNLTPTEIAALEAQTTKTPSDPIAEITGTDIENSNLTDTSKIKAVLTGDVPIPVDGKYIEGTKNTGVVIEYKNSQFVWVPVPTAISSTEAQGTTNKAMAVNVGTAQAPNYRGLLYNFTEQTDTNDNIIGATSSVKGGCTTTTEEFREPDTLEYYDIDDLDTLKNNTGEDLTKTYLATIGLTKTTFASEMQTNYKEMVESVAKYGGFYVGRYETSISGTTVASVSGVKPMTAETASGNMWYGMYDKQKNFTTSSDKLQSSMIWGSQWDAMLNWMLLGTEKAKVMQDNNTSHECEEPQNTGAEDDIINNIYDLEGNEVEWTLEAYDTYSRVIRGGDYGDDISPAYRFNDYPIITNDYYGSRLSLYIK